MQLFANKSPNLISSNIYCPLAVWCRYNMYAVKVPGHLLGFAAPVHTHFAFKYPTISGCFSVSLNMDYRSKFLSTYTSRARKERFHRRKCKYYRNRNLQFALESSLFKLFLLSSYSLRVLSKHFVIHRISHLSAHIVDRAQIRWACCFDCMLSDTTLINLRQPREWWLANERVD